MLVSKASVARKCCSSQVFQPAKFASLSSDGKNNYCLRQMLPLCRSAVPAPRRKHHHYWCQTLPLSGQCVDTPRSVLSLSIGSGARVWSPEAFSLSVPNASVTQKYCSCQVTVQHKVCRLHPQRAVHHVVLSPSTTGFQLIIEHTAKKQTASSVVRSCHDYGRLDHAWSTGDELHLTSSSSASQTLSNVGSQVGSGLVTNTFHWRPTAGF